MYWMPSWHLGTTNDGPPLDTPPQGWSTLPDCLHIQLQICVSQCKGGLDTIRTLFYILPRIYYSMCDIFSNILPFANFLCRKHCPSLALYNFLNGWAEEQPFNQNLHLGGFARVQSSTISIKSNQSSNTYFFSFFFSLLLNSTEHKSETKQNNRRTERLTSKLAA